jgi:hypothetical protein
MYGLEDIRQTGMRCVSLYASRELSCFAVLVSSDARDVHSHLFGFGMEHQTWVKHVKRDDADSANHTESRGTTKGGTPRRQGRMSGYYVVACRGLRVGDMTQVANCTAPSRRVFHPFLAKVTMSTSKKALEPARRCRRAHTGAREPRPDWTLAAEISCLQVKTAALSSWPKRPRTPRARA